MADEGVQVVGDLAATRAARELLDGLTKNLDGTTPAATVINRKRAAVHNLLAYAVGRLMLAWTRCRT